MSWVYSPGPEVDYSHRDCLAGEQSAPSRSIRTVSACSPSANGTATSSPSLSGMTFELSTASPGEVASTWCPEASPAKTLAALDPDVDWTAAARHFGLRCSESLTKCGLRMCSPRTPRCFALEDSTVSSKDWPAWGMSAHGACLELATSVRRTVVDDFGSVGNWPTPRRAMGQGGTWLIAMTGPSSVNREGKAIRATWVRETARHGRFPRPSRVEWLMGWPIGWTALAPLATDRFRQWLHSHGAL